MTHRNDREEGFVTFDVWLKDGTSITARAYRAAIPQHAAEQRASDDYVGGSTRGGPYAYCVRDGITGKIYTVTVDVVARAPAFIAISADEVPLPPTTHILWHGHVLCEDLRLRRVPRDWPEGQFWIAPRDIDDDVGPTERCAKCWAKAPELAAELRQMPEEAEKIARS